MTKLPSLCAFVFVLPACIQEPSLAVKLDGDGAGRVVSDPAGIDCGKACGMLVDRGIDVMLTAVPRTGSGFVGWRGGGCSGAELTCIPELGRDATIYATFTLALRELTIEVTGTGMGTVTSAPLGIACGGDCVELYAANTVVLLTATAATGSRFAGWLGEDNCTSTSPCEMVMDRDATIEALFERL